MEASSIVTVEPSLAGRAIIVNGVSKSYAMTGWRIGYAAGPAEAMGAVDTLQSHATSNPSSISQRAALAALTGDQRCVAEMTAAFQHRRDLMMQRLTRMGRSFIRPTGAFYLFGFVGDLGPTADAVAGRWLDEAKVSVVPGEGFGHAGYVRFSFACADAVIQEGMDRLERLLRASSSGIRSSR
jgi:aspartate aminotransferase